MTFVGINIATFYLLIIKNYSTNNFQIYQYYSFWLISLIQAIILFIAIPFILDGCTIWMFISRVQILQNEHGNKSGSKKINKTKIYLKRSLFSLGFWLLIVIIMNVSLMPWQINDFIKYLNNQMKESIPFNFIFMQKFIKSIISFYLAFLFVDLMVIIINKKKVGLIDWSCECRIVWIKHYEFNADTLPKLIPFRSKNKQYNIIV